jgi:hypothetical protein
LLIVDSLHAPQVNRQIENQQSTNQHSIIVKFTNA